MHIYIYICIYIGLTRHEGKGGGKLQECTREILQRTIHGPAMLQRVARLNPTG